MEVEILGGCTKQELEGRIRNIAAAGTLSRSEGNVFDVLNKCDDYEKNLRMIKRIIKMGHKSIIEHDYLVFALCDVSPIVEQTIIGNRLTSFTIKSRREVDFRTVGFYVPEFRNKNMEKHENNAQIQEEYKQYMQSIFNQYGDFIDKGISKEDARFILPYCYNSNIIMGLNARELEKMVISLLYGQNSKISELKELGLKLFEIIKEHIPYLVPNIEEQEEQENSFEYLENISERPPIKVIDKAKLISYTPNADDIVLKSSIMYHYQCDKDIANKILEDMEKKDSECKEKLMNKILNKEDNRELEQVSFTFQIPISLSILTHLTRHRMHSLLVPEFVPMWDLSQYVIPESIKKNGLEEKYVEIFNKNVEMYNKFKEKGIAEEDLIYFYLGGQMCNVLTTINGRSIKWISRMRACNKAQWQIRYIVKDMISDVKKVAPLMGKGLGPSCVTNYVCNEGKESCGLINNILANKK